MKRWFRGDEQERSYFTSGKGTIDGSIILLYTSSGSLVRCESERIKMGEPLKRGHIKKNVKKTTRQIVGRTNSNYAPALALIGMFALPILYYIVLYTLSIPPGVPPQNHDHLLHQFGMPIVGMLGYLVGLMISLGEDMRALLPWLKSARK